MTDTNTSLFKRSWNGLGSLYFFWWLCMLISSIFYFGVMGIKGGAVHNFKAINKTLLIDWITIQGSDKPLILGWLFIVFVLVFLLSINLTVRLLSEIKMIHELYLDWKNRDTNGRGLLLLRKSSVFLIHFSIIFMIFIHLASSVSGMKFSGLVLLEGHVVEHPLLPFSLECQKIIKPHGKNKGKHARPTVVLKPVNSNIPSFTIPGWYRGYYYNVYADYIETKPKPGKPGEVVKKSRSKIGLKLTVNTLHVFYPLLVAAGLCFLGILIHLFSRPETMGLLKKYKTYLPFLKK